MKISFFLIFILLQVLGLANKSSETETLFLDDMGRKLELKKTPLRIISLSPAITEMLFDLGIEDRIIGVSYYSNFPQAAQKKIKVGTYVNPLFEKIVALKPDLIIGTAEGLSQETGKKFDDLRLPLYVIFPKTIKDIPILYKKLGKLLGLENIGVKKAETLSSEIRTFFNQSEKCYPYTVFYLLELDPIMGVGRGSFIDDLLLNNNFKNVLSDIDKRYPVISLEKFVKSDPDVLLVSVFNQAEIKEFLKKYNYIRAIKNHQVYFVNTDVFNRPGPRIVTAMNDLSSIRKKVEAFYKKRLVK